MDNHDKIVQELTQTSSSSNDINVQMQQEEMQELVRQENIRTANKNMLYGALWCIGGTVATLAEIGYIFWGAILFGAIQFFQGLYQRSQAN
jgi:hypothetical protein